MATPRTLPVDPPSLRPYQHAAIVACRREMAAGHKRVVLVLPTGAGKTRVASHVVHSALAKGSRVLWLAHRSELVEQAALTLESFGIPVGVVAASSGRKPDPDAPCQVASIQTLLARGTHRPPASLIIWDEAHHASEAAECWAGLLSAYEGVPLLGLTATPERTDGAGLGGLFDGLVVGATVRELTDAGHLVPYEILRPDRQLEPGQIAQDPVDAYVAHGGMRQGILFARNVEEATRYAAELNARGVRAECVTAQTGNADREASLELFRRGVVRVLTNVYVLTEGTDLPAAAVCILARGVGGAGLFIQMVGRVLRPSPGKTGALILDLRGVTHNARIGLPDDERVYSLEGRGIRLAETRKCQVCSAVLEGYPCASCGYCPEAGESAATVVVGVPLVKFERMRQMAEDDRKRWVVERVRRAIEKNHKPASVKHVYRAVFGEDLSSAALMAAVAEVKRG
jgi:superfamily II DNA or RNA helicase